MDYWQDIKNIIDTIEPKTDKNFIEACANLYKTDQGIRTYVHENYGYVCKGPGQDTMKIVDINNYKELLNLIKNIDTFSEESFGNSWISIDLVVMHNRDFFAFFILTYKDVVCGNLDVRNYAKLLDDTYTINYIYSIGQGQEYGYSLHDWVYIYAYPTGNSKKNMNKFRKQICLEDIDTYYKKQVWQFQNNKPGYFYGGNVHIFSNPLGSERYSYMEDFHDKIITKRDFFNFKLKIYYRNREDKKVIKKETKDLMKIEENKQKLEEYKILIKENRKLWDKAKKEQIAYKKQIYK